MFYANSQKAMAEVALRKPFSLLNSEFNEFLFAPVGDEGNGMTLSVISALTRLDIDPWREAARLAELSKENAAHALAPVIAGFPDGRWVPADADEIATRLAALLPRRVAAARFGATASGGIVNPNVRAIFLVICLISSAAAWLAMGEHRQSLSRSDSAPVQVAKPAARP